MPCYARRDHEGKQTNQEKERGNDEKYAQVWDEETRRGATPEDEASTVNPARRLMGGYKLGL